MNHSATNLLGSGIEPMILRSRTPRFLPAILVCVALALAQQSIFAANHYINAAATGTADGSSWTNAYPTISAAISAGMIRGDTYYLAGGTYNENPYINVALSGTQVISIIKADPSTNGGDPGWNASYATNPAVINGTLDLDKGYITVNGVTGSGTGTYGIQIVNSALTDVLTLENAPSFSISHCEIRGAGYAASTLAFAGISWNNIAAPMKNTYIGYCWIHEMTTNGIQILSAVGTSYTDYGFVLENSVISETGGCLDPNNHGQGMQLGLSSEMGFCIIRNNTFRNVVGSGMITFLGATGFSHHDFEIYNNLFYITNIATYNIVSPGVIWAHMESAAIANISIINNTFYNIGSPTYTTANGTIVLQSPATNNIAVNNVWENCRLIGPHVGITGQSNNGYFGNTLNTPIGTPKQVNGSSTTFVNSAGQNFQLVSGGYAIGRGTNFPSIFTTDITGLTRGGVWDLGAYQVQTTASAPPSNAQVGFTVGP